METMTPEFFATLIQAGGAPMAFSVLIYFIWHHGVKQEILRAIQSVEKLSATVEKMAERAQMTQDRVAKLEVLAEFAARELTTRGEGV